MATSQTNLVLPSKPDDFNDSRILLEYLLAIKSNMESLGLKLRSTMMNGRMGTVENLGIKLSREKIAECVNWTRPTYYTPPGKSLSYIPSFVFGSAPPSILDKLKEAYEIDTGSKYDKEVDGQPFDKFGWKQLKDGKYYNKYLDEVVDNHPLLKRKSVDNA